MYIYICVCVCKNNGMNLYMCIQGQVGGAKKND